MGPKPFFKDDEAKQDFMIVLSTRGVLLEQFAHGSRAKVLIDLRTAVKESIGHLVVDGTAEPFIHYIDSKSTFRAS